MKKILLSFGLLALVLVGRSQAVLNEFYHNPASGEKEYIEIYNAAAAENLNCYTLIIKYHVTSPVDEEGFYVINYPNITLPAQGWSVASSGGPSFNYQAGTYNLNPLYDFSWNDPNLVANGGYFKQFKRNGGSYDPVVPPVNITDILQTLPSGDGAKYISLLYKGNDLVNGLIINGGTTIPVGLTSMPNLNVPGDGTCPGFTAFFSAITTPELEYMTPAIGSSNGAFRTKDGLCGTWEKSNNPPDNTPGAHNGTGTAGPQTGVIVVGGQVNCPLNPNGSRNANWFVVNTTPASAYPMDLSLYSDNGPITHTFESGVGGDEFLATQHLNSSADINSNITQLFGAKANKTIWIVARSTAGCFATILEGPNSCSPLPVKFKSFNAARNHSVVGLNWETSSEQNNTGFAIERLVGAGGWQQIGFVSSKAAGGNSSSDLSYQYTDLNNTSAMTQYRLKQIDFDNKSSHSDIRAVRGLGQAGKIIVYPNPSNNGRVSVVFEEVVATRDISLMDMSGRMIKQIKAVTNNNIQFDNLTPGVYSLRVINRETGDQVVEKIVVNNR